jgi:hypothetical protein
MPRSSAAGLFTVVMGVLLVLNIIAALLSTTKEERGTADAAAAEAAKEFEGI